MKKLILTSAIALFAAGPAVAMEATDRNGDPKYSAAAELREDKRFGPDGQLLLPDVDIDFTPTASISADKNYTGEWVTNSGGDPKYDAASNGLIQ